VEKFKHYEARIQVFCRVTIRSVQMIRSQIVLRPDSREKSAVQSSTKVGLIQVLHVDDDVSFLKVAKQCLKLHGSFEVDTASSVDAAKQKMKLKAYDAIVSDYVMPGKDGLQFLNELREKGNRIPFIIFTGKGREEVAAIKALNLGADGYFGKLGEAETIYGELARGIYQAVRIRKADEAL
jgi:DNA-binding NtrC family response regulator